MAEIAKEALVKGWILHLELQVLSLQEMFDNGEYARVTSGFEHIARVFTQIATREARELEEERRNT